MRKLNVLELTTTLEVGGTERMLSYLARGLDAAKFNVTVACLKHGGPIADELSRAGVSVVSLRMKSKLDYAVAFRLYRLLRERRIDILHSYLFHANLLSRIVGRLARVPVIISSERTMGFEGRHRLLINRLTSPLADAYTGNAEAVRQFMISEIGLPEGRTVVIHNGVDLKRFDIEVDRNAVRKRLGLSPTDVVCASVARLDEQKGISYLIEAARKVVEEKPDTRFIIVGDGPLRKSLEGLSTRLGLEEHVLFLGARNDVAEILKASDVFVLPSLWEGFPNVVLEAMASGLPVVATKTSGTPEAVADGDTGLLVEPKDAQGLAEAIRTMVSDEQQRRAMGARGKKRVMELFSLEKMITANEELYLRLAGRKGVT